MSTTNLDTPATQEMLELHHQIAILAWLHAELVHELRTLIVNLTGQPAQNVNPARARVIRERAIRIAQLRAAQLGG